MPMKDAQHAEGTAQAAYNVQLSSQSQFVIHYSIQQTIKDINTLKPHVDTFQSLFEFLPKQLTADAGYGSEEDYVFLEEKGLSTYVKYSSSDKGILKSQRKKKNEDFHRDNLYYNHEQGRYIYPMAQPMENIGERKGKTKSGYLQKNSIYQAEN